MGELDAFEVLLKANWEQLLLSMIVVIVAVVAIKKFYDEIIEIFGIETKSMKKEREHKEEVNSIKEQLKVLEEKQKTIAQKSDESDVKIDGEIKEIKELLTLHIVASMRSTLWRIHGEATSKGYITPEGLKTFVECGNLYVAAGGDDIYHDKLHPDVIKLPVREE